MQLCGCVFERGGGGWVVHLLGLGCAPPCSPQGGGGGREHLIPSCLTEEYELLPVERLCLGEVLWKSVIFGFCLRLVIQLPRCPTSRYSSTVLLCLFLNFIFLNAVWLQKCLGDL